MLHEGKMPSGIDDSIEMLTDDYTNFYGKIEI